MTANAADHLTEITKDDLPASSISVFIIGFVAEQVQNDDDIFKSMKVVTSEFVGGNNAGKKFYIRCRYLKTDERIEKKVAKMRRNSSIMVTGELTLIDSEFKVEIQDLNFLSMSIANIESSSAATSSSASSLYSWPTSLSSRISAQEVASTLTSGSLTPTTRSLDTTTNNETTNNDDPSDDNDVQPSPTQTPRRRKRKRK